ncbi:MAG: carboxypeptidase regulatory-like domain-containing protein, partial [Opitutaceae bacterium]|nr:carboxypeptidase regulatory-like domain-containing protein [Opitutaceae bacterium]
MSSPLAAQNVATGVIEGRVQNAASGSYLVNARISVAGTTRETLTDAAGAYRLGGLPVGEVILEVFFTGMAPRKATVSVTPGVTVKQDFRLIRAGETGRDGDVVVMNPYIVASEREYDATAIAINEQRFAANRKDVVSTDAFGEINQGNIGEFLKFIPGVSLDVKDGNTPSGIMIRGFDPNYTNVTLDGGQLASTIIANTQTSSRQFVLDGANINNLARIEVTKLPTPDMSANLLGGAVNFVSRSAFERPRMETRISTYFSANAKAMDFEKTAGPLAKETFKILPSADFMFVHPVNSQFGYVVTAQHSSQFYLQNRTVLGARFTSAGATLENPYTTNINTNVAPNRSDRDSGAVKFDYKPWDGSVFSLHLQANASKQQTASRSLNYNVGGGTPQSWTQTDVRGANSGGSVGMGNSFQERHALTRGINGSYTFTNDDWAVEAAASYSNSNNRTRDGDKGFFRSVNVSLPGVARVNLLGIQQDDARFSNAEVYSSAGVRVDELSLANYYLTTAGTERLNAADDVKEARLNVARELSVFGNPVTLKVGGSINDMERDLNYTPVNYTYVGPDGIANNADNTMASFVDSTFAGVSPGFGRPAPQWPDSFKVWQSFMKTPNHWTQTTSQAGDVPRNVAIRSPWLHETITAAYLMGDIKLLRNRLRIVGGVRYELTEDEGLGFKQDADAVLVKDASGNVLDTDPNRPGIQTQIRPELAPSGSFAYNSVLYAKRQYYASRDYHYYHPSAHVTYSLT